MSRTLLFSSLCVVGVVNVNIKRSVCEYNEVWRDERSVPVLPLQLVPIVGTSIDIATHRNKSIQTLTNNTLNESKKVWFRMNINERVRMWMREQIREDLPWEVDPTPLHEKLRQNNPHFYIMRAILCTVSVQKQIKFSEYRILILKFDLENHWLIYYILLCCWSPFAIQSEERRGPYLKDLRTPPKTHLLTNPNLKISIKTIQIQIQTKPNLLKYSHSLSYVFLLS
jgi:hypothetical protein